MFPGLNLNKLTQGSLPELVGPLGLGLKPELLPLVLIQGYRVMIWEDLIQALPKATLLHAF